MLKRLLCQKLNFIFCNPRRFFGSIRGRLVTMMLVASSVTALVGYAIFAYYSLGAQRDRLMEFSESLVEVLSQDLARIVLLGEFSVAADVTARLDSFGLVRRTLLYNREGEPVFQYHRSDLRGTPLEPPVLEGERAALLKGSVMHFELPLLYGRQELGRVYLKLEAESLQAILQRDMKVFLGIGALMLLLALLLAIRFESRFNAPILRLIRFFDRTGKKGALESRIQTDEQNEQNEFGTLYREVNRMLERIEASREALRIAAVAFETPNGMVITDAEQRILQVNRAFSEITGYSSEEAIGQSPSMLQSGRHDDAFYQQMWQTLQSSGYWEGEIYNRQKSGEVYPERLTIQSVKDENAQVRYYVGSFVDLTSLKQAQAQAHYLGLYDPLTGLANRRHLAQKLQAQSASGQPDSALLCFDLDNHRLISETFGHDKADELLIEVAERVRAAFGQSAFIARLGADVLAIIQHYEKSQEVALQAEESAKTLLEAVQKPYLLSDNFFAIKARVGIALFPVSGVDAQALIKQADLALQQGQPVAGQQIRFFDPEAESAARHYLDTCTQLQNAINENQLQLHYQTQVDTQGRAVGAEALIRWRHPQEGMLSPGCFIPAAERSSHLILEIGHWVLENACAQLAIWQRDPDRRSWTLAVNISAQQFIQEGFVQEVQAALDRHNIPASRLKLELTESVLVDDIHQAVETMTQLRALGLEISLDDFGTGYASLSYLSQLPLSQIKIDRTFVSRLLAEKSDAAIVQSVLSLGETFELTVVAEGVETKAQYERLRQMGCAIFQGFYFSRPAPADQLSA